MAADLVLTESGGLAQDSAPKLGGSPSWGLVLWWSLVAWQTSGAVTWAFMVAVDLLSRRVAA